VTTRAKPFEPTDCSVILDSVLTDLKMAIEESNAVVTHDPLPTVTADATQLKRVFQNLVSNGIKFRQGETLPEIHVGAEQQDSEWVFSVRDNGIGIDPRHFERMFVLFQRLHGRDEYPGTGIGLAVCKKTVERHGGRMWVESEPGKGSTFYFTIPHKGGST
jgi:light-regulated signal transduction histidine kinase (bacteriophytochrome)